MAAKRKRKKGMKTARRPASKKRPASKTTKRKATKKKASKRRPASSNVSVTINGHRVTGSASDIRKILAR